ncbi:hypothetical protein DEM27_33405 [Metarhizobium album]|uniref:Uncharacterized protein n=2 Tax=Metarhizobium album TaxID=2182425 RepID=A0A2U2DFB7_9HYPH|nr:hypothetical protein DEM27_33405 [Rhizobium album]
MVGGDIRRQILEFIQMSYDLSTWAACINWRSKENQKEWLDELREKIEAVQEAATILKAVAAVADILPVQAFDTAVERLQAELGREGVYVHHATAQRALRAALSATTEGSDR